MKPSEALRRILATPPDRWEIERRPGATVAVTQAAVRVTHHSPALLYPLPMRGIQVRLEGMGVMRADYPARWAANALGGAAGTSGLEVASLYEGPLFRARRVMSADGRGGLPLPITNTMTVERDRYLFLRLIAEVAGTPGFDEAWGKSGLALADMPWRGETDEAPPPKWSPIAVRST